MSTELPRAAADSGRAVSLPVLLSIGLTAGTLDITDNLIFNELRGVTPTMVFQYIASGLIGAKAFAGGPAAVTLGILLHYLIALIWTAVFLWARRRVPVLSRRPVASGLLYGGFVYLFMNLVVLPLSRVPHAPRAISLASRVNGVLAVVLFIGLTISLLASRMSRRA